MMRTWYDAVKRGLTAYVHRDEYVYFYGAKNYILDYNMMNYLWESEKSYFSRYTESEKEEIFRNSLGKRGIDCSALTGWICTGDMQYSYGQMQNSVKNKTIQDGPAGSILFTTFGGAGRHIGIDMGYGFYLHTGYESTDKNIADGKDSIMLWKITENRVPWEYSGRSNVIDYAGATER